MVACNDVDSSVIKACLARIERNGGQAMPAPGDVTDEAAVQRYVGGVLERWGRIDILVNNAALLGGRGVLDESAEFFERAVRVSSLGYFLNTKHVGRSMAERGIRGSIICISSSKRLDLLAGHHRLRVQQGRGEQLRPGGRDGSGSLRHPREQLHADGS